MIDEDRKIIEDEMAGNVRNKMLTKEEVLALKIHQVVWIDDGQIMYPVTLRRVYTNYGESVVVWNGMDHLFDVNNYGTVWRCYQEFVPFDERESNGWSEILDGSY